MNAAEHDDNHERNRSCKRVNIQIMLVLVMSFLDTFQGLKGITFLLTKLDLDSRDREFRFNIEITIFSEKKAIRLHFNRF